LYFYRARYYSPELGRFINEDPLGFLGSGPNLHAYVGNDPINFSDPSGLERGDYWDPRSYYTDGWTTLRDFGTAAEAFTDVITFGSASTLNDALGANVAVDRCGIGHKLASASGFIASIALGGALGGEAAEANAGKKGFEFSHWIPKRTFAWVDENLGINIGEGRGAWNGNYVSQKFHYLTDFSRYPAPAGAALRWGPKLAPAVQQVLRIPWLVDGAAAGALIGGAGATAGRSCECH
jgi:uncharacterized protein RhaS with RHS repeats